MNPFKPWCFVWLAALMGLGARSANAHPMGNFSINHYARFSARGSELNLRYILDFAEIPTADRMTALDKNADGKVSASEKSAYLQSEVGMFLRGLTLRMDGKPVVLAAQSSDLETRPGAGGLPTLRVWMDCRVPLPANEKARIEYNDANFVARTGWMEIIAVGEKGRAITDSNASSTDQSRGLTIFPIDARVVPPRQSSAAFSVVSAKSGMGAGEKVSPNSSLPARSKTPATNNSTPQNRFTQSIGQQKLTPALVLWGLLFALAFGAVHALSPGHGKTMVAAYLVGSRGTPRHAVLLGLVVTITHTLGVFALGMALLFASRYILPEKLFPVLSALSGLLIFGVGLWLFLSRWQGLQTPHSHGDHSHTHDDPSHSHEHGDEEHSHAHGVHMHSHGGRAHSHAVPDGPLNMKTLVALGISGGIVPCPEALVVLLAAVKLHRIGYGMVLITAFSIGLAAALIAIGLLVVSARGHLSRLKGLNENSAIVRYLPLGSAAVITLIGAVLTLRATMGGI